MAAWDDQHCLTILGNCRRDLGPGKKLLIAEQVLPDSHAPTLGAFLDLEMLLNGRIVADGSPREVLTAALLAEVFQVQRTLSAIPWITSLSVCPTR